MTTQHCLANAKNPHGALVRRVLLAVARRDLASESELVRHPLPGLIDAAAVHRISGLVYHALQEVDGADPSLVAGLRRTSLVVASEHLRVLADLHEFLDFLDGAGIPSLVLKGPVVAETLYDEPWHRSYLDLDVLVPAEAFGAVIDALPLVDGVLCNRNWRLLAREMKSEVTARLRQGTTLDLHWHPIPDARIRRNVNLSPEHLFANCRMLDVGGRPIATLDSASNLVYLAAHACWSGAHQLVWHIDLRNALERDEPNWAAITDRARSWAVELPVAVALQRMCQLLGVNLPPEAQALSGSRFVWHLLGRAAGRRSPLHLEADTYHLHQLIARASRGNSATSGVALLQQLADVVCRGGPRRVPSRHQGLDPEHPSSIFFEAPEGREDYLAAVVRASRASGSR